MLNCYQNHTMNKKNAFLLGFCFFAGLVFAQESASKVELNFGQWGTNLNSPGFTTDMMMKGFDSEFYQAIEEAKGTLILKENNAQTPSIGGVGIRFYPKQWVVNDALRFSVEISSNVIESVSNIEYSRTYTSGGTLPDSTVNASFSFSESNSYVGLSPAIHYDKTIFGKLKWVNTLGLKTMFGTSHNQSYDINTFSYYYATDTFRKEERSMETSNGTGGINEWFVRTGIQAQVLQKLELGLALSMHRGVWHNHGLYKYNYINTGANISIVYTLR